MKQETNNEMDLLLRRLGRRQDVFAPDAEDHLDTDELSAYAENVLPAKTRSRYTEHLAECSRCRELVVQLTASAGVVIAAQADKVPASWGWRKFLASLFTPMVLRYAAPALGLIVVAAIGFMVLRRDRPNEYVSQVQTTKSQQAETVNRIESNQQPQNGLFNNNGQVAESPANKDVQKDSAQPTAPAPQASPAAVAQNAPTDKSPATKPESQPIVAAAEPPPPAPAKVDALTADEKRQQNEDAGRNMEAGVNVSIAKESKKNFEMDGADKRGEAGLAPASARARPAKSKSVVGDLASAQGAAAPGTATREARDDKDSSAETRSVAGRQFRKQGGIWVDTAYNAPREVMNLARGSEAYRTVVADEPAIKSIADQLDGEIIVVWKGRAYHIQ